MLSLRQAHSIRKVEFLSCPCSEKTPPTVTGSLVSKWPSSCAPGLLASVTVLIAAQWTHGPLIDGEEAGRTVQGLL